MVNASLIQGAAAERRMVLAYAPVASREGLGALLDLDDALAGVLRTVREPMLRQVRLTWWYDALARLDSAPPPAQPVLQALGTAVLPIVTGAELARMIEGWEELLEPHTLSDDALHRYADVRGATLFRLAARVLGAADEIEDAGRGRALADLAAHSREPERPLALAAPLLARATGRWWSRAGRPLGAMAHLAAMPHASPPARAVRALWHRMTGR
jgi:15-cis-phytoene synthase